MNRIRALQQPGGTPKWMNGWKQSAFIRFFLFAGLAVLLFVSLADRLVPKTYDIQPDTVSEITVVAPRQIEDRMGTEKARAVAAERVPSVFRIQSPNTRELIRVLYDKLELALTDKEMKFDEKLSYYRSVFPRVLNDFTNDFTRSVQAVSPDNPKLVEEVRKQLDAQRYEVAEEAYFKLPRLTQEDLDAMEPVTSEIVAKLMTETITDAESVRSQVTQLVNSSLLAKNTQRELVQEIAKFAVFPNRFYDAKGTEEARSQARNDTKTVYFEKNETIVRKGDFISKETYERLEAAGLLKNEANRKPALGLSLLSLLMVLVLYMHVRRSESPIAAGNTQLLMLALIMVLTMVGIRIVSLGQNLEYPYVGYLAPVAMGTMLTVILLDVPLAGIVTVLFAVVSAAVFNTDPDRLFDLRFGLAALASGYAAIFSLQRTSRRASILRAGIMVSLASTACVVAMTLLDNRFEWFAYAAANALASGLITTVLVYGLIPFFETVFGILSPLKLVELSNPNHPLLRKLLTETPGTYHHSVMVGNLSEAAAESIGANGLLCRVGSYYHDIGKTKRPVYFIENQMNMENPHDNIDPGLSMSIITAHPRDGVEMLKEHKIPKAIQDIAEQHHGTTLLKFFYYKAAKQCGENPDKPVLEADYRYPGPKAQSREAAIVGIADCVEAAVRSLRHPTIEQIDQMVRKIIKDRLDDGQFDECDLTIRELDTVGKALKEALLGIFHSRIEYPSDLSRDKDTPSGGSPSSPRQGMKRLWKPVSGDGSRAFQKEQKSDNGGSATSVRAAEVVKEMKGGA